MYEGKKHAQAPNTSVDQDARIESMVEKFGNMTSQQVSDMIDALDVGVKSACEEHDKIWGTDNV